MFQQVFVDDPSEDELEHFTQRSYRLARKIIAEGGLRERH
jgi:hypothetical protein